MKNNELRNTKLKKTIQLIGEIAGAYLALIIFWYFFIDGILQFSLASIVFNYNPNLYHWFIRYKDNIFFLSIFIVFTVIIYLFISHEINKKEAIYEAIEKILDENFEKIELPESEIRFSKKLNEVKYEYILSKAKALEEEQKRNDLIVYMAHDLKTPLTSVIGYLTLINDEKDHLSKETESKYINIALDKAKRVEDLTNQFFEITRYNLHDMEITYNNIDLSVLIDQLIEECYPMLKEKKLECHINKHGPVHFYGDGDKLARAFENLIKNAINYSHENTTIDISLIEKNDLIEIVFKNAGDKIPQYKLDKIFDKFYRADSSRNSTTGGTGLGLAITKEIIELHSGQISVKNDDEYIKFMIQLPK